MADRFIAIQSLLCFVSYTLAQQSSLEPIVVIPARTATRATENANTPCLNRNPPVVRRADYTYFPGIGGYKLHSRGLSWDQARITCDKEGGHLAIINSLAERDAVMKVIKAKTPYPYSFSLSFHDVYEEGHYVTIHGQTLARAGFAEWNTGEPNNLGGSENCGYLAQSGRLNDDSCGMTESFICELPIY